MVYNTNINLSKGDEMMQINIKNCNNIASGTVEIEENKLNIKYGVNGTGKTTISKAIRYNDNQNELKKLKSFGAQDEPSVICEPVITSTLVFDEAFINQIVFQQDEVIGNTFEVFVKTPNYEDKKRQLDTRLELLRKTIEDNENITYLKEQLVKIYSKFSLTSSGEISKKGVMASILGKKSLYNIPPELEGYREFIDNKDINIQWIDWKNKGEKYDIINKCPYCSENVKEIHQERKKIFSKTYKKADAQNLKEITELLELLKDFMKEEKYNIINGYIRENTDTEILQAMVKKLHADCDILIKCFDTLINFGKKKIAIAEINSLDEQVNNMRIPIELLEYLGGEKLIQIIEGINDKVIVLQGEVGILKKEMGELKALIQATIQASQRDINQFLKTAGINYELQILAEDEGNSKTILKQCFAQDDQEINSIRDHLSWGEKNAFALILFMYYAQHQNPDLIILDDPVSSFDSNKKFAILHRMFKKGVGKKDVTLAGKTVLLLTHDFEPITDFVIIGKVSSDLVTASYIWNSNRIVEEKRIQEGKDVKLIITEALEIASDTDVNIISRVTFLRKYCELQNRKEDFGLAYEILSCLMHGTEIRRKTGNDRYEPLDEQEIRKGIKKIQQFIPEFEYTRLKNTVYTEAMLIDLYREESNSYFKIQIFRALVEISKRIKISTMDDAWFKFIDETYHIENDYLHYLSMKEFNIVPDYIKNKVEELVSQLSVA
jgi:ABC-type Mn2+/Zn2+ transport system ATPase subunit